MSDRQRMQPFLAGIGLVLGAGVGLIVGVLLGGGAALALGLAVGATFGLLVGAVASGVSESNDRTGPGSSTP